MVKINKCPVCGSKMTDNGEMFVCSKNSHHFIKYREACRSLQELGILVKRRETDWCKCLCKPQNNGSKRG